MDLPKNYDFSVSEKKWYNYWEDKKIYYFDKKNMKNKNVFSIDTPPPTVSGRMHIGHAFSYTQGDMIVRYRRMRGHPVFYPFGTDDNGLPTERLVEKLKKVNSKKMTREDFIDLCNKTVIEIKPEFIEDWKKIGVSAEYGNSYSTLDKNSIKTSQKSFVDLYRKGHVYQEESPVSWCPHCITAIAQAEFENIDLTSSFNDIVFKQGEKELLIATTRPELLPACVALCAHPDDSRYKSLKGKFAKVPLFDYEVPILFDDAVSMEKGTGLMMVCTFGDKEDIEKWHKHKLPLKTAINPNGTMNSEAKKYEGLKIIEARKKIIEDLKKEGLLVSQNDIVHAVNVHERCGTEIEILKTKQWFVRVLDKKEELLKAADEIKWYPEFMKKRYVHWVENLQWDWCISRQRFFGVPFPVWYDKQGRIVVPEEDELPLDPLKDVPRGYKKEDLTPEKDVMDTWATSSVTPQTALGWADGSDMFKHMFPETVRLQAHDIIRTWAFYTIVKSLLNNNSIPWKNIIISGFVLDPKGKKMSKSKGNIIAPQDVLSVSGADALRFWAACSKLGDDLPYQEKDIFTGKKTVTKIWNASKFTLMNLEGFVPEKYDSFNIDFSGLEIMDKWLISKLMKAVKSSTDSFEGYEYARAKLETDMFFWQVFCDNYLEFVKYRTYNGENSKSKSAAQRTLYYSLFSVLKLFAPIMPFITEEVYHMYFKKFEEAESIHITSWPKYDEKLVDDNAEKTGDLAVRIISEIRKYKSTNKLSLKAELKSVIISCSDKEKILIQEVLKDIKATGSVNAVEFRNAKEFEITIEQ